MSFATLCKRLRLASIIGGGLLLPWMMSDRMAHAATFTVTTLSDNVGAPPVGSLRAALAAANSGDTIQFDAGLSGTLELADVLPYINKSLTIDGNGTGVLISGKNAGVRPFFIGTDASSPVTVSISDLGISGTATGGNGGAGGGGGGLGAGGALFVNEGASVTIENVSFANNSATGGNGGANNGITTGGGGGMGGHGGNSAGSGWTSTAQAGSAGGGAGNDGANNATWGGGAGGGGNGGNGGSIVDPNSTGAAGGGGAGLLPSTGASGGGGAGGGSGGGSGGNGGVDQGGGGGGSFNGQGGAGGFGGGGGGGTSSASGGAGGFGGGGGGSTGNFGNAGNGGFGGGGGGARVIGSPGAGGFGGGDGGRNQGGGGGDALGGAIFVRQGGTLTIRDSTLDTGSVTFGSGSDGGLNGIAVGSTAYVMTGTTLGLEITTGQSFTASGSIAGDGGLSKSGDGLLILAGNNTYTGNTTVSTGRLAVNGSLTSDTTIGVAGELGGSGTITGNVSNQGMLAAGNSIGTLTIDGDFDTSQGSTIEVEINDAGHTAGVNNDLVTVTGAATINGGNVDVRSAPGTYADGTQYTFLTANALSGTFDSITDDLAFFDAVLGYSATSAFFTLVSNGSDYTSIAADPNQNSIAVYLDDNSVGATGDLQTIFTSLQPLTNGQVQMALSQMSGEIFGTSSQVGVQNTTLSLSSIGQQLRSTLYSGGGSSIASTQTGNFNSAADLSSDIQLVSYERVDAAGTGVSHHSRHPRPWRAWVLGYGLGGNADSDGNAAGLTYGMGGTTVGLERDVDASHRVGVFGGYIGSHVEADGLGQSTNIHGGQFGTFLTGHDALNYYILMGGFQFDDYESERAVTVGGINRIARGDTNGWQSFASLERGLNLRLSRHTLLQPFGGLQYVYVRQSGFTETGAGALNLQTSGIDTHSLRSRLGSRLAFASQRLSGGRSITPDVHATWMHEFLDTSSLVTGQFVAIGGAGFATNGLDLGRDWALVGGGFSSELGHGFEFRADYTIQANDRQVFHLGSGMLSYSW